MTWLKKCFTWHWTTHDIAEKCFTWHWTTHDMAEKMLLLDTGQCMT